MGRDYSTLRSAFWTGDTGKRIRKRGDDAVVVALYLVSAPTANMIGLYYLPLPTLAHETGRPIEGALKALASLSEEGFAHYDEASETIWVPQMAYYQIGESLKASDNRCVSVLKQANEHRKSRYFSAFVERYWDAYSLPKQKPLGSPSEAPSDPLGSQDQEQDQDQEQEPERERSPAPPEPVHAPAPRQTPNRPTDKTGRTWQRQTAVDMVDLWHEIVDPGWTCSINGEIALTTAADNWAKVCGGFPGVLNAIRGAAYINNFGDDVGKDLRSQSLQLDKFLKNSQQFNGALKAFNKRAKPNIAPALPPPKIASTEEIQRTRKVIESLHKPWEKDGSNG